MKFYILTYGCTLNKTDSNKISAILKSKNWEETKDEKSANILIINSCTVKHQTENRILKKIQDLYKINKPCVLTGCLYLRQTLIREKYPHLPIISPGSISKIYTACESALLGKEYTSIESFDKSKLPTLYSGIIASIPLAEGCVGNCTYCETRLARGKLRSYSIRKIKQEVEEAIKSGAKEIQLTAQDTGAYGLDINTNIIELLNEILKIEGDFKIRLGMINPNHVFNFLDKLIGIYKNKKMYKFLHIPVQSGSTRILKKMNRQYTINEYLKIVKKFRMAFPNMTIATDIIIGFPDEKENDFKNTLNLIKTCNFNVLNISRFTPRPGTLAKDMIQIENNIIKERTKKTSELFSKISIKNNKKNMGKYYEIIITEKQKTWTGRDINYKQIAVKNNNLKKGQVLKVKITGYTQSCLIGERV